MSLVVKARPDAREPCRPTYWVRNHSDSIFLQDWNLCRNGSPNGSGYLYHSKGSMCPSPLPRQRNLVYMSLQLVGGIIWTSARKHEGCKWISLRKRWGSCYSPRSCVFDLLTVDAFKWTVTTECPSARLALSTVWVVVSFTSQTFGVMFGKRSYSRPPWLTFSMIKWLDKVFADHIWGDPWLWRLEPNYLKGNVPSFRNCKKKFAWKRPDNLQIIFPP